MSRVLSSLRMTGGANCHKDARSAGAANKERLVFLKSELGLDRKRKKWAAGSLLGGAAAGALIAFLPHLPFRISIEVLNARDHIIEIIFFGIERVTPFSVPAAINGPAGVAAVFVFLGRRPRLRSVRGRRRFRIGGRSPGIFSPGERPDGRGNRPHDRRVGRRMGLMAAKPT